MSSFSDEVYVLAQCNECAKTRKRPVFPEAHAWNLVEGSPIMGYRYQCPKCGTTTTFYETRKEAHDAWNKHLTTKPIKKKKKKE